MDIKTKTMKTKKNTDPIQMRDHSIAMTNHSIQQIIVVISRVIITNYKDSCMRTSSDNKKSPDPYMMSKQRQLCAIINCKIRIWGYRIHMMSNNERKRTQYRQIQREL